MLPDIRTVAADLLGSRGSFRRKKAWCSIAAFQRRLARWWLSKRKPTIASTGSVFFGPSNMGEKKNIGK
ncbi:unnamed protein product [Protopolystoma xenopodis]|uniref:Uncharacterized protein n=1 Tax=Protopolystoma xenopodis TaxID=117903 RepID=A0A3S5FE76_9PLAT|nr:unnamed protein product [Protopolystoma xenopodis]